MLTIMYARPKAPSFFEVMAHERPTALILAVIGAMLLAIGYACPTDVAIDGIFLAP
jgi:hypothetical protein